MVHVIRDIAACVPYYRFFQDGLAEYLLGTRSVQIVLNSYTRYSPSIPTPDYAGRYPELVLMCRRIMITPKYPASAPRLSNVQSEMSGYLVGNAT